MSAEKPGDCCSAGPEGGDAPLPVAIQVGDLAPEVVAHVEHIEGEPVEQFQQRLAGVLIHVALGLLGQDG